LRHVDVVQSHVFTLAHILSRYPECGIKERHNKEFRVYCFIF
jgi:hypothetical protein